MLSSSCIVVKLALVYFTSTIVAFLTKHEIDTLNFTDYYVCVSGRTFHAGPSVNNAESITVQSGGGGSEELEDSDAWGW